MATNQQVDSPSSNASKPLASKSKFVFVTTDYHSGLEQITSVRLFQFLNLAPEKSEPASLLSSLRQTEQWSLPIGTSKILRRYWEHLTYKAPDGSYPNDPSELVKNAQIFLSVDGEDFFADFVDSRRISGAALRKEFVINTVMKKQTITEWLNIANNYTTEQSRQIDGFASIRNLMQDRLDVLRSGKFRLLTTKPLQPSDPTDY